MAPSHSLLPWPAVWTLTARTRPFPRLLDGFHPEMVQRVLRLRITREAVARDPPRRTIFGDLLVAVVAGECDGAWWSRRHGLSMAEKRGWHQQTVSPSRWRRSCDVECGDKAYVSRSGAQCPDTQDRCARYLQPSFAHAPCMVDTSPGAAAFAQADVAARWSLPCVSSGGSSYNM